MHEHVYGCEYCGKVLCYDACLVKEHGQCTGCMSWNCYPHLLGHHDGQLRCRTCGLPVRIAATQTEDARKSV